MWKKSRIKWLQQGEKNTRFFHHSVTENRFQNKIYSIQNDRGEKFKLREDIEAILNSHFSDILGDPGRDRLENIEVITSRIPSLVLDEKN